MIILREDNRNKRVGIITLVGYDNYGNRLQNYATQEIIKSLNFNTETFVVRNLPNNTTFSNKISRVCSMSLGKICLGIYKKTKRQIYYFANSEMIKNRQKVFRSFVNNYIAELVIDINSHSADLNEKYEYFITGSDQVWNPFYNDGSSLYFLGFAPEHKRIAYAPSFGMPSIPEKYIENYKKWLSEIPYLSVREESGAKIVKELTERDVPVLVDPTLMLTREKWLSIAKEDPYKPDRPYLLTYFLGEVSRETKNRIEKIAKEYSLEIVRLADMKDKKRYLAGPSEFIDYINSAALVCTDSFHGTVFSILMETPFIVFDRVGSSMYSRIETLLNKFKLHSRQDKDINDNEIFNIDFSHIHPILEEERRKALNFLKEALNVREIIK